jgi:hypothetical protein
MLLSDTDPMQAILTEIRGGAVVRLRVFGHEARDITWFLVDYIHAWLIPWRMSCRCSRTSTTGPFNSGPTAMPVG